MNPSHCRNWYCVSKTLIRYVSHAAAATTKVPPLPLSTLQDRFDNEKLFCKMTEVDFFPLSQLFRPGVKFLHGGMLPIFDAIVYLSLYLIHL